uniref:tRNA(Ile)-lysidine synthase n=1 Tax=Desulfobacca acetoxidans TaxID=60893 RepID=A0A7C3UWK0_9BACT
MSPRNPLIQPLFEPADPDLFLPAVRRFVRGEELFKPGLRVLAAVSGGPDSVALLHTLVRLGPDWGLHLGVAHFNHGLRGRDSQEDAAFVAGLAQGLDLPLHLGEGDVRGLARTQKISLQMAARRLRLAFLEQIRRAQRYDLVALGHTADDQVELFFLRLLRGAGPEGIKGMWPCSRRLVRPLLAVGKGVALAWLQREKLPYREDLSNLSRNYLRNRIRLDLMPLLQRDYNPRLKAAVWRLMALLQEDERSLGDAVDRAWEAAGTWVAPDYAALSLPRLLALSPALQTRLLRRTLGGFLSHQEITADQVQNLLDLAQGKKSGGLISFTTCRVARAGSELHLFPALPPPPAPNISLLQGPGAMLAAGDWRLEARFLTEPRPSQPPESPDLVWLDADRVSFPLGLRPVLPGDRFWPEGAKGARKMQDFLVDARIPRWLRPYLPLVLSEERIIWVPGLRRAEPVKITPRTSRLLELSLSPATPAAARIRELLLAFARRTVRRA